MNDQLNWKMILQSADSLISDNLIALIAGLLVIGLLFLSLLAWLFIKNRHKRQTELKQESLPESTAWHAKSAEAVLAELKTNPDQGLSDTEAQERFTRYGPNRLPEQKPRSALVRFISQFHNLLIYVLLATAAITAMLEHWTDTFVILGVVLVNSMIGYVQEGKAEDALQAIKKMLSSHALVLRNEKKTTIPASDLVPGDIVMLQSGDKVPADLRLITVKNLQIQEAVLTGESVPIEKRPQEVAQDAVLGDRFNLAYSGTLVTFGQARGVVVGTGVQTEIGHISQMVSQVQTLTTPLLLQMAVFARWITAAVFVLSGLVFAFGILVRGGDTVDMFMTVVGLAVAAIPEGLPAILTVTLAIGVQSLASRNAIIRRLPAVETLGAVSIICSDKTGTLTRNEMTVSSIITEEHHIDITGTGYEPAGDFQCAGQSITPENHSTLLATLQSALYCNDSRLELADGTCKIHGDPMEAALLVAALKAGLNSDEALNEWPRRDLIPFESEHKFMATLHHNHQGEAMIHVKGAPERLLAMCTLERTSTGDQPINPDAWHAAIEALAKQGQRVLGVASKSAKPHQTELSFNDLENGLVFLGLFGLIDPPRSEAIAAVNECHNAGIRVKMITGDHEVTACSIAAQLNLNNSQEAITGKMLDTMNDEVLLNRVQEIDVFARVSPEHKLRLVTLLQSGGAIVAMTGDGVNDAPALRRADVGIAMGHKGTEAAKEASEMVITDDNFATIVHAVKEGRTVYENLKKAVVFLLPVNGGESISIIIAILFGFTLPITPLQILWVNMVSSVALAMALAFDPPAPDIMQRPPRPANEPILSGFLVWRIFLVSSLFALGIFGIFEWSQLQGSSIEEARTYAVNTLVMMEVFYLLSVRYLRASALSFQRMFNSKAIIYAVSTVVTLQLIFTYAPFMEQFFDTRPVDFVHGFEIIAIGLILFGLLELEKGVRRKFCHPVSANSKPSRPGKKGRTTP
ncbi:cation-transporting P-type ATPase [Methylicorpusculum sp.]|uniref:cation-transporting P-type ATPase n=2 Tax=Methylicorpusculum sp. TaxID=2713644 RepID=UPI002731D694|nr:cation-transporting P-type ATPase [Methylicorpusculum sp.]MDP2178951.1 cation-transporting P-type ATPase [Methylicorpusculum sp.]MDP3530964.1 cation-transporting P-type ATPase [Methylicorpusculum sp.]